MRSFVAMLLLVVLSLASTARADQLDQFYEAGGGTPASVNPNTSLSRAQTFTVGVTGTLSRTRLDMMQNDLQPGSELTLDVRPTDAETGAPLADGGSGLGSIVVDATLLPGEPGGWDFDFSSQAIPVVAGQRLAIVARSNVPHGEGGIRTVWVGVEATYAGGEAWVGTSSRSPQPSSGGAVDCAPSSRHPLIPAGRAFFGAPVDAASGRL